MTSDSKGFRGLLFPQIQFCFYKEQYKGSHHLNKVLVLGGDRRLILVWVWLKFSELRSVHFSEDVCCSYKQPSLPLLGPLLREVLNGVSFCEFW